jgi:hypothetical protein
MFRKVFLWQKNIFLPAHPVVWRRVRKTGAKNKTA